MKKNFSLEELPQIASEFIDSIGENRIILFDGDMGSGKTTFISEVCRQLGAEDDLGSPTFSIINEYIDKEGNPIYHFDLYRLESPQEALDIGIEDYFESGNLCLVEWPDRLGNLIPEEACTVSLKENHDGTRMITM